MPNTPATKVICAALMFLMGGAANGGDLEDLQGVWRLAALESSGEPSSDGNFTFRIKGYSFEQIIINKSHRTIAVDAKNTPMIMKTSGVKGLRRGDSFTDIFELSDKELVQKRVHEGEEIPKAFDSLPANKTTTQRWKRIGPPPDSLLPVEKRLEGEWEIVEAAVLGKIMAIGNRKVRMRIEGESCDLVSTSERKGKFSLNGTKKEIDMDYVGGPFVTLAIFEFIDKDTFRICEPSKPNERPVDFSTKGKVFYSTSTFKRVVP